MGAKKILLLAIAIIVALVCLGFLGVRTFAQKVTNNRDCEWANIDHIEMRAAVNIPPVSYADCDYDETSKRKTTVFTLNKNLFDIEEYSLEYGFKRIAAAPENFCDFDKEGIAHAAASDLFYREGQTETNSYKMLLDAKNGKLWVDLQYFYAD